MIENMPETVYILGAGFSCNASLPSQGELTAQLLQHQHLSGSAMVNKYITTLIGQFLEDVFHIWDMQEGCPALEEIYTCLDFSIQSGHFLGPYYTPKKLQAIRRFITHRIFQILEQHYQPSAEITELLRQSTKDGLAAYITLNWDTVLEKHLAGLNIAADYRCDTRPLGTVTAQHTSLPVYKLHGSANWAYCENCKYLFYTADTLLDEYLFLYPHDFALFGYTVDHRDCKTIACPHCSIEHLSTHIVTFSYRKNFRTNYFSRLWQESELVLQNARQWVFIGYSLPMADYQFKQVLKSAELQLSRRTSPQISLITKSDARKINPAIIRYAKFFGSNLPPQNIYHGGIRAYLARNT